MAGRTLLGWSLEQILASAAVTHIVVVAPASHIVHARDVLDAAVMQQQPLTGEQLRTHVVPGGADRRASVAAGLSVLDERDGIVLVHDAARALAPPALFDRVVDGLRSGFGAVIPALPVVDTIKRVDAAEIVVETPDREQLRAVQTPQGFVREVLTHAHDEVLDEAVTDDAGLVERSGTPIHVVPGDAWAMKITTQDDLGYLAWRLQQL